MGVQVPHKAMTTNCALFPGDHAANPCMRESSSGQEMPDDVYYGPAGIAAGEDLPEGTKDVCATTVCMKLFTG